MKILYYFKDYNNPMYLWQKKHIIAELGINDIQIEIFNPLIYENPDQANDKLLSHIKKNKYDLFMTSLTDKEIYIETLNQIKRIGIPCLLICFDNLTVPFNHKIIAPYFDLVWITSNETKYLFDKWGVNSIFLPYASNPYLLKSNHPKINRICFIGTPYGSRGKMIQNILNENILLDIYCNISQSLNNLNKSNFPKENYIYPYKGPKTPLYTEIMRMASYKIGRKLLYASFINKFFHKSNINLNSSFLNIYDPVSIEEMIALYNGYTLSLSSTTNRHTGILKNPVNIINLRSFEIPSAGGVLFTKYNQELANYFSPETEAIYYNDNKEMTDKAKYYLDPKNINLIKKIKYNARQKSLKEHTWSNRFQEIFKNLGI